MREQDRVPLLTVPEPAVPAIPGEHIAEPQLSTFRRLCNRFRCRSAAERSSCTENWGTVSCSERARAPPIILFDLQ